MSDQKRPKYVFKENGKIRQVTHWDLDYLPKEEIEALYRQETTPSPLDLPESSHRPNTQLALVFMGFSLLLLLLSIGLASYL